ncbi:WW domain-containing oxidoreductase-like [Ptychodera flava]|uniref:WW domain-containing oxidoreductase-like n=1 Tax=Ptychodera flava TaxID=63121 RepID=UPI003969E47A
MTSEEVPRVCIITGANSGIGFEAAKLISDKGYEVILACRSESRGKEAENKIVELNPSAKVKFMKLDLGSLESIHHFVDEFHASGKPLHVLCNNAGVETGVNGYQQTDDGFEMTLGVNHLGHFLLTHLLLEDLKKTAERGEDVRIVVTSSEVHNPESPGGDRGAPAHIDVDNVMVTDPTSYDPMLAYKNSKLANIIFTYELARRLEGSGVTANCLCPGFIPESGLFRNISMMMKVTFFVMMPLLKWRGVVRTVQDGGETVAMVATDEKLKGVSGKFYAKGEEKESSKESYDKEIATGFWKISEDLVKLDEKYKLAAVM